MFLIFAFILIIFDQFLSKRLSKDSLVMGHLVFFILTIVIYFLDKEMNYQELSWLLDSTTSGKAYIMTSMLLSLLYWIFGLIKNRKEELAIVKNESLLFFFLLLGNININIVLIICYISFVGVKFESLSSIKLKHLALLILTLEFSIRNYVPEIVVMGTFIVLLLSFFLEKIKEFDHYIILVTNSMMEMYDILSFQTTMLIYFLVLLSFWRYKLTSTDFKNLISRLSNTSWTSVLNTRVFQRESRTVNIEFIDRKVQPKLSRGKSFEQKSAELSIEEILMLKLLLVFTTLLLIVGLMWLR